MPGVLVLNSIPITDAYGNGPTFVRDDAAGINRLVTNATVTIPSGGYGGQVEGLAAAGTATSGNPVWMGGTDGSDVRGILTDTLGRIVIAPSSSPSQTKGFASGRIVLASTSIAAVRETTYTEQTSDGYRSVISSSAQDAPGQNGAATLQITYYTSAFAGPYTDTISLNGTAAVGTNVSNICYIEFMEVLTAGGTGSNVGTISLKSNGDGSGTTIWSISATSNRTFGCHHYVAAGKTCYVTGFWAGIKGADTTGSFLYAKDLTTPNAVDRQLSDTLRVPSSGQAFRIFPTPMTVSAGYRITGMVHPDSTSSRTYYTSFDFYEE